jgi:acyl-CoA reductase-like NAD-dependent aldehyde dehydrogenase
MQSVDPSTGELIREYPEASLTDIDNAWSRHAMRRHLSEPGPAERREPAACGGRLARADLSALMTLEMANRSLGRRRK